jgi:hypothetical protein
MRRRPKWPGNLWEGIAEQNVHAVMKRDKGICRRCGADADDVQTLPPPHPDARPMSAFIAVCLTCRDRERERRRQEWEGGDASNLPEMLQWRPPPRDLEVCVLDLLQ